MSDDHPVSQPVGYPSSVISGSQSAILLAELPFEDLADQISGKLARLLGWGKAKIRAFTAWLSFIEEHSNRVWPGERAIAYRALCCEMTVRRMRADLRRFFGDWMKPLSGEELYRGPGAHNFKGVKRSPREVDTYDLSFLQQIVPQRLIDVFVKPTHSRRAKSAPHLPAQPSAEVAAPGQNEPSVAQQLPYDEENPQTWDPLNWDAAAIGLAVQESPAPLAGDGVRGEALMTNNLSPRTATPIASMGDTFPTIPTTSCSVSIEINAQIKSERPPVPQPKSQKNERAATALKPVLGTKKFPIVEGTVPAVVPVVEGGAGAGFLELRKLGIAERTCYDIIHGFKGRLGEKDQPPRGDAWAYKLARYAAWAKTVGPDGNRAGFAIATWKNFKPWPGWFDDRFNEEERQMQQQAVLEANARSAKPKVAPPPRVTSNTPIPPEIRAEAYRESLAALPPGARSKAEKRGANSPAVDARARIIMKQRGLI